MQPVFLAERLILLLLRDGTGDLHGQTWMANEIFERRN